ncbi:MAG: HutD family protein [Bacteroidia bacterium]
MKIYNSFKTNIWSGGATTELFIAPKNAQLSKRNFHFRLSTATIETDESNFTPLPAIDRIFMVVGGTISLSHNGGSYKQINQFEQDYFSGSCLTKSKGKAQAFNLMLMGENQGSLRHKSLAENDNFLYEVTKANVSSFIYLVNGKLEIFDIQTNERVILKTNELLLLKEGSYSINARFKTNLLLIHIENTVY